MEQSIPTQEQLADLKKAIRKAEHVSADYRKAEAYLDEAIDLLNLAGFNTTELVLNLAEVKVCRSEARIARLAAKKAYADALYLAAVAVDEEV